MHNSIAKSTIKNIVNDILCELTAYHASPNNFSGFSTATTHRGIGYNPIYGYGIYVTTNKEYAMSYIKKGDYIYIVEIPDDINNIYLDLNEHCPKNVLEAILNRLYSYFKSNNTTIDTIFKQHIKTDFVVNMTYGQVLNMLSKYIGVKNVVSDILHPLGYVGIKYIPNLNIPNVINYVIFKSVNIKIISKNKV